MCKECGLLSFAHAVCRLANRVCFVQISFDCQQDECGDICLTTSLDRVNSLM